MLNVEKGKFTHALSRETPIGTTTLNIDGEFVTIVAREKVFQEVKLYNIITDTHLSLFAAGILTSSRLSNTYPIKNLKYVKDDRVVKTKDMFPELTQSDFDFLNSLIAMYFYKNMCFEWRQAKG